MECQTTFDQLKEPLLLPMFWPMQTLQNPLNCILMLVYWVCVLSYYQIHKGLEKVTSYASRSLTESKTKYPVHKLEFLGLKRDIAEQFHEYLYGNTFDVYTDNNPLTYVLTTAKLDAMGDIDGLLVWLITISIHTITLEEAMWKQLLCPEFIGVKIIKPS